MKKCQRCGRHTETTYSRCDPCREKTRIEALARYHANKDRFRREWRRSRYGLSNEDFDALLEAQGGTCGNPACSATVGEESRGRALFVDHDHTTGRVRGLLCNRCNRTIGMAQDDPTVLQGLADYLTHAL